MVENGDFMVGPRMSPEQSSMQPPSITIGREPTQYSSATAITHEGDTYFVQVYNLKLREREINGRDADPKDFIESVAEYCERKKEESTGDHRLKGDGSAIAVTRTPEGVDILNYNGRVFTVDKETVIEIPRSEEGIAEVHLSPKTPIQIIAIAGEKIPDTVSPEALQKALQSDTPKSSLDQLLKSDLTQPHDNRVSLTVYPYNPGNSQATREETWNRHVKTALWVANSRVPIQPPRGNNRRKV